MRHYRMTAKLRSPLVVRRERQSQRSEGVTSVPGTLVRGALAELYLEQHGQADGLFRQLFLDEDACRYGSLDPAVHSFPLSAASCKREAGFRAAGKHGLVDLLWLRIARRLRGEELAEPLRSQELRCQECDQDLKPKEGFWGNEDGKAKESKKRWRQRADTHVGIDRFAHSAHESILYSLPVLEPRRLEEDQWQEPRLTGLLEASDDVVEQLKRLLAADDNTIRIGHARTRGYGQLKVEIGDEDKDAGKTDPDAWSRGLIEFLRGAVPEQKFDPARHFFFSVDLPAGALLLDAVLRYSLDPSGMADWLPPLPPPNAFQPVLLDKGQPFKDGKLWCLGAITKHERLRGWNAVHGLPRQDEWIVTRGAVYAYLFEGDAAGRQALREKLTALEESGLGARRGEGLGRVIISDDFHRRFHRQETSS